MYYNFLASGVKTLSSGSRFSLSFARVVFADAVAFRVLGI